MRPETASFSSKPNSVAFLSWHLILHLPINITVTSKYHGIINNIISDWQMKNWLWYISKKKEMTARNKNATFMLVLNITNVTNFEVWNWFK